MKRRRWKGKEGKISRGRGKVTFSREEVIGALLAHSPMYFSLPPTLQKPQPRPYDWNWSVGKVPKVEEEGGTSNRLIVLLGRREGAIQRNGRWRGGRSDVALLKRDGGWSSGLGRAKKGRKRQESHSNFPNISTGIDTYSSGLEGEWYVSSSPSLLMVWRRPPFVSLFAAGED